MVTQVTQADIIDQETDGANAAALINDTKRAINELISAPLKFEGVLLESVGNDTLFKDSADGVLKYKNAAGVVNALY